MALISLWSPGFNPQLLRVLANTLLTDMPSVIPSIPIHELRTPKPFLQPLPPCRLSLCSTGCLDSSTASLLNGGEAEFPVSPHLRRPAYFMFPTSKCRMLLSPKPEPPVSWGSSAWFRGLFKSTAIRITHLLWVLQRLLPDKSNIDITAWPTSVLRPAHLGSGAGDTCLCLVPLDDSTLWPRKPFPLLQHQKLLLLPHETQLWRGLLLLLSLLQIHMLFMQPVFFFQVSNASHNKLCARCWNCNYSMPVYQQVVLNVEVSTTSRNISES